MLERPRNNVSRRWLIEPAILTFNVGAFKFLGGFQSSLPNYSFAILQQEHLDFTENFLIIKFILDQFLLLVTIMLSKLLSGIRMLIEIVHLVRVYWAILDMVRVMTIFALKTDHLTILFDVLFQILKTEFI
jgi:hypothetical protein